MTRIFGFVVGIVWAGFAWYAFTRSREGWGAGNTDLGFWWGVIGTLLAVAAVAAVVGTWLHRRQGER